jgi:hypothetical protein
MAARLGNVLYWTGCILAGLIVVLGLTIHFAVDPASAAGRSPEIVIAATLVAAAIVWLVGRALRYILAGT